MNLDNLVGEYKAVGLAVDYIEIDGTPGSHKESLTKGLVDAVRAAHERDASSTEALALRDLLGSGSAEWAAYLAERKRQLQELRRARYIIETDPLLGEAIYDHFRGDAGHVDITASTWKTKIEAIKAAISVNP